jgi:hypothetical protein
MPNTTVEFDTTDHRATAAHARRIGLQIELVTLTGPGGGNPLMRVTGDRAGIAQLLTDEGHDLDAYPELG